MVTRGNTYHRPTIMLLSYIKNLPFRLFYKSRLTIYVSLFLVVMLNLSIAFLNLTMTGLLNDGLPNKRIYFLTNDFYYFILSSYERES